MVTCLRLFTVLVLTLAISAQGDSCRVCNCQFNTIETLVQLMRAEIRNLLVNDTESGELLRSKIRNVLATDTQLNSDSKINSTLSSN